MPAYPTKNHAILIDIIKHNPLICQTCLAGHTNATFKTVNERVDSVMRHDSNMLIVLTFCGYCSSVRRVWTLYYWRNTKRIFKRTRNR